MCLSIRLPITIRRRPVTISPSSPERLILTDGTSGGPLAAETRAESCARSSNENRSQVTIDVLPDDALLEIFQFYANPVFPPRVRWQKLVQVCRRWRNLVFGSPRFLDLQLHCTGKTPARTMLGVWPELPITMREQCLPLLDKQMDNILAALEHHDRVCYIYLSGLSSSHLEQVGQAMQKPFPALTDLCLTSNTEPPPVLPDAFLGGSAPCLRELTLCHVPFPALPNLLLSATNIRRLQLINIPPSGYFSPQQMVAFLSAMTKLDELLFGFDFPQPFTSQESLRQARAVLPALTSIRFRGMCGYLEDLVAGIDAPLLKYFNMSLFSRLTFHTPQLFNFISCTNQLRSPCRADVVVYPDIVAVKLYSKTCRLSSPILRLEVLRAGQLSSLAQACRSSLSSVSTLDRLDIRPGSFMGTGLPDTNIENTQWLELLRIIVAVKNLHLVEPIGLCVMSALGELAGDRATEVLPALQNIFLDPGDFQSTEPSGPLQEVVEKFIAVRQLSGHTVTAHPWERWSEYLQRFNYSSLLQYS